MNPLMQGLILEKTHWVQMETDVIEKAPQEACGIIAGKENVAKLVIPVTNILHSPFMFRMDPQEELNAFYLVEKKGWEVLAVYHSHPNGMGEPSQTDLKELTFPGIIYLIWSSQGTAWECRGFLMNTPFDIVEVPLMINP